jgi:hypothetical protein
MIKIRISGPADAGSHCERLIERRGEFHVRQCPLYISLLKE